MLHCIKIATLLCTFTFLHYLKTGNSYPSCPGEGLGELFKESDVTISLTEFWLFWCLIGPAKSLLHLVLAVVGWKVVFEMWVFSGFLFFCSFIVSFVSLAVLMILSLFLHMPHFHSSSFSYIPLSFREEKLRNLFGKR